LSETLFVFGVPLSTSSPFPSPFGEGKGGEVERGGLFAAIFSDEKSKKDFRGIYPERACGERLSKPSKGSLTRH